MYEIVKFKGYSLPVSKVNEPSHSVMVPSDVPSMTTLAPMIGSFSSPSFTIPVTVFCDNKMEEVAIVRADIKNRLVLISFKDLYNIKNLFGIIINVPNIRIYPL